MMSQEITGHAFNRYAEEYTTQESEQLECLNEETQKLPGAQMNSGHLQGQILSMFSQMIQPRNILEIGTYTGYSAICLSRGLKEGGLVHTIDKDDSLTAMRLKHWQLNDCGQKIKLHIGDAANVIQELDHQFDLIFIDADKRNYVLYFDLLIDKVPLGTYFIADNTLFHGEVVLSKEKQSKSAGFIHEFNAKIAQDDRVEQVLLPIRDGLTIIRKIK